MKRLREKGQRSVFEGEAKKMRRVVQGRRILGKLD